jgi:hypothetical protein
MVNENRFQAGRIPVQDFEQSRVERLTVEIKATEAGRVEPKGPR